MVKKDMRMTNVTITTRPVAAPPLQLPFNESIHQEVTAGQQLPAVVPVHSVEEMAVSLRNIHRCAAAATERELLAALYDHRTKRQMLPQRMCLRSPVTWYAPAALSTSS
jgi:hypothetical protein